jgi:hypothetical protein
VYNSGAKRLNPGATLLLVPSVEPLWLMCECGRCTYARRRTGTGHVFQAQRVRRILQSYQYKNDYELQWDAASYVLTCLERTFHRIFFFRYSLVSCRKRSTTRRLPVLFLPPSASVYIGRYATTNDATTYKCYNKGVLINKIRMLQRTRRNTIGRRSTRVRMSCRLLPPWLERQSSLLSFVRFSCQFSSVICLFAPFAVKIFV